MSDLTANPTDQPHISVRDLSVGYGERAVQHGLSFDIRRGSIFVIMGASGCGKSTVLQLTQRFGVMYQAGALWSSMTVAENVALPLEEHTSLDDTTIRKLAELKLALVGLKGFEDFYPAQISGGMNKRVGVARALALDPEVLFFDEPSAGLDPISSRRLDDMLLALNEGLGCTMVLVTHELESIFTIADDGILLDAQAATAIARGNPRELSEHSEDNRVRQFLRRGNK
jgi:phospholipid/cholesterol/gamma-HCH transport system ATP-binding protein